MPKNKYIASIEAQLQQIDADSVSKRFERIVTAVKSPTKVVINGQTTILFNSNDYLGLRMNKKITAAEHRAAGKFGSGPGAVRFISGTLALHKELEEKAAAFHGKADAILFSSAYMANLAVLTALIDFDKADPDRTVVLSDELNHRSIIDGIRMSTVPSGSKAVYRHLDYQHLEELLRQFAKTHRRAIIITDGIFSMLGQIADLKKIERLVAAYQAKFTEGILWLVDDCHGVGVLGKGGRGSEELEKTNCDLLIGTFGKAFGCEGGYVAGNKTLVAYLREKAAPYIFSNPISPASAAGAATSLSIVESAAGKKLLKQLNSNIALFKKLAQAHNLPMANDSIHPIQPLLVQDATKARRIAEALDKNHHLIVTPITYPAVAKGDEEIRIQLSAAHGKVDIERLVAAIVGLR